MASAASTSCSIRGRATASGRRGGQGGGSSSSKVPVIGFSGRDPANSAGAGSRKRLTGRRELLPSREVLYPPHSRHGGQTTIPYFSGTVPACDSGGVFGVAAIGAPDHARGQLLYDRVTVFRHNARTVKQRACCAPNRWIGASRNADVLEFDGDRFGIRHLVYSYARVIDHLLMVRVNGGCREILWSPGL